ncbi:MAG: UDP-N-acetylglucosamine 1-carboxyvinyltransferase [Clostridia bacterium]|nr:UDP-N-acetylglucosamine 1-carboxyvinyltransferase [Clostridia bacterium]
MGKISICGGRKLCGEVDVQGSKNAALPILAASVLCSEECVIGNCPDLADTRAALEIIGQLGGKTEFAEHTAVIDAGNIHKHEISNELMSSMRSSVLFLGPLVSRMGRATISYPGGCAIGLRPIDLHLKAFRELGVEIEETGGCIYCKCDKFVSGTVNLLFPSVGATENIMLLSAVSEGETVITNAAREPEIVDLQNFLNAMGAKISGAGSEIIRIIGVEKLQKVEYNIISDRIFATTCACAVACCGGDVVLKNANAEHLRLVLSMLKDSGCKISTGKGRVRIQCSERLKGLGKIITSPYPGFPTDAQALFMASFATAEGTTVFVENIFESRYKHVSELMKMGADIIVDGRLAAVTGCNYIQGAKITAGDLRGGAALVIAGLSAIGDTEISGVEHIDRGYESVENVFSALGAMIKRK